MKKFLLSLATVLCAGAFASADEVTVNLYATNFTANANNSKIATYSAEGFTFTLDQASSSNANRLTDTNHLRVYKGAELTISGDNGQTITSMVFTGTGGTKYYAFNECTWSDATGTWTGAANSVTLTNSAQTRVNKVVITYTPAEGVVVPVPTFSIEPGTFSEAQTVELTAEDGCTIYYTLNGETPTDDVNDGSTIKYEAPIEISTTTTIKAIAFDADDNASNVVTGLYKIVELLEGATGSGTEADPYNPIAAYNEGLMDKTDKIYVKGIIVSIEEVSTSYGNASYYISEDGTEANQLYIYRGYYIDGAKFTSEDQIKVGDEVVVYGPTTTYKDVPQIGAYNELVTINGDDGKEPVVLEGEGTDSNPFTVADVIAINPTETSANEDYPDAYWVKGYIVGYSSSTSSSFTPVFNAEAADNAANIILAPAADCTDQSLCIPVQLPSGDIRAALNLVDNPSNLGKEVYVFGNIYKYFGLPGVKNTSAYKLDPSGIEDIEFDNNNAPVEYFNLQGVRVANPENGLYIMRQGDKVVKVIK